MRKVLTAFVAAAVLVILLAAPALAKDPFEPLVTTQDASNTTTTTTTTANGEPAVIGVPANTSSESMPNTGSDVSTWVVLSYVLVVAGGVGIVLGRTLSPARV
jgi:hypothetical protein